MNDRRIEQLLRMSAEVEAIEAEAEGRTPMPVFADREGSGVIARLGRIGVLAAAACLVGAGAVGAWGLWNQISGAQLAITSLSNEPVVPERITVAVEPKHVETAMVPPEGAASPIKHVAMHVPGPGGAVPASTAHDCGVILTIVHDLRGMSRCVEVKEEDWHGRCATQLTSWELASSRSSTPDACSMTPSRQMLVLALSGPTEALPTTQRRAEEVAACILRLPRECDAEGRCYRSAAETCLPPDVSCNIETVALR